MICSLIFLVCIISPILFAGIMITSPGAGISISSSPGSMVMETDRAPQKRGCMHLQKQEMS